MVPAARGANPSSASNTEDLPAPEGPTSATREPGGAWRLKPARGGRGAVVVLDAESLNAQIDGVSWLPGRAGLAADSARHGRPARDSAGASGARARTSSTRVCRRLPFGAGVELGPGPTERDEDLRGDQEHGQRGLQAELAPQAACRPRTMATKPTPNPAIRSMASAERKATRKVRMVATRTPSADSMTSRRPCPVAPEGAQGRQSFNQLEEPPGQRSEAAPLPFRATVRFPPEVDHGDRHGDDERHDNDQGEPILGGHPDQEHDRYHGGHGGLGDVAREVGVE
jgi:hypothetical protein